MKKRILSLLLMIALAVTLLSSCKLFGGKDNDKDDETATEAKENLIYDSNSELYFIVAPSVDLSYVESLKTEMMAYRIAPIYDDSTASEPHKHEIVIGNTGREISNTAISRLDRVTKKNKEDIAYLVYSDGSSVAIVWEENPYDEDEVLMKLAIEHFRDNFLSEELVLEAGVAYSNSIDLVDDYYREIDRLYKEEAWAKFEEKYGKDFTDAYKSLYSIYSPDCIVWLANLYDPDICVCVDLYGESECKKTKYCGTGGWYYSNSARDNYGYLPDAESTNQALNFLSSAGLAYKRNGSYLNIITDEMKEQISNFIYALEEPNGYFYHPQWGIEFTNDKISRRARDLSWCEGMLKSLKRTPKYTTASGMQGENPRVTSGNLTERLGSSVSAVSKVIAANDGTNVAYLQNLDNFKNYLAGLDLRNKSYHVGNELTASVPQIQERDRQIGTEADPTPLMDYLIEWLNAGQNPETGNWDWKKPGDAGYSDYYGTNGLLKISGIYSKHKVVIPHAREACISAMADIINPAQIGAVVDLYNTWFAIQNIFDNLNADGGAEGAALVEEIQAELRQMAPDALKVSRDKIKDFLKPDGSASYGRKYSSSTSQGVPAAVPNSVEGDVNGSTIAINGIIGHSASALGITKIPTFGEAERFIFRKTIRELSPLTKEDNNIVGEPITFDYDTVGEPSSELTYGDKNPGTGNVIADPTGAGKGNVIEMNSPSATIGDSIKVPVAAVSSIASCYVFEGDFYLAETSSKYPIQITLGGCYMLTFRTGPNKDDKINLVGSSSGTDKNSIDEYLGITVDKNQWFRIKVEYYKGDADTVRIKVYADTDITDSDDTMKLYAVTDNYYDSAGTKITAGTSTPSTNFKETNIFVLSGSRALLYFDNVSSYNTKQAYTTAGPNDTPYINVDKPDSPEKKYDFEDGILPTDFKVTLPADNPDAVKVDAGSLVMNGGTEETARVEIPVNIRTAGAKCAVSSLDITYSSAAAKGSTLLTLNAKDVGYVNIGGNVGSIFDVAIVAEEDASGKYLTVVPKSDKAGTALENVRIPLGESLSIKFAYYHNEDIVLFYTKGAGETSDKYEFAGAFNQIYEGGAKLNMDTLYASTASGVAGQVKIDNVISEKNADLFLDAVTPDLPEKIYGFESDHTDVKITGAAVTAHGGDMALNLKTKGSSVTLPVNQRSNLVNSLVFSMALDFETVPQNEDIYKVSFLDKSGNVIFAMILGTEGGKVSVYEVGKGGRLTSALYTFEKNSEQILSIEVFNAEKMIHFKSSGGSTVAKSSVFAGEEFIENGYASVKIETLGTKASVFADDLRAESLYTIYKNAVVTSLAKNPEKDYTSGITFEYSNSGSLPPSVYSSTNGNNYVSVENVKNDITGEYSNAVVLNKSGGGNDSFGFVSGIDVSSVNSVVFEADIKINATSSNELYRLYFCQDEKRNSSMYMINLSRSGEYLTFADVSSDQSDAIKNVFGSKKVKVGEWFKLRIELYKGGKDTVRFKVLVNGEVLAVSNNFAGAQDSSKSPQGLPKALIFYCMGATRAQLYMDNVKMYTSDAVCTDAPVYNK